MKRVLVVLIVLAWGCATTPKYCEQAKRNGWRGPMADELQCKLDEPIEIILRAPK